MTDIQFDYSRALAFFSEHELTYLQDAVKVAHHSLHEKTGAGSDYLGWIDLPKIMIRKSLLEFKKQQRKSKMILMYF